MFFVSLMTLVGYLSERVRVRKRVLRFEILKITRCDKSSLIFFLKHLLKFKAYKNYKILK